MVSLRRKTRTHLRIIDRLTVIEYNDVLMFPQRHTPCVEMTAYPVLLPHEIVSPFIGLRHYQSRREHSLGEKDNRTSAFRYAVVLFPQQVKRNHPVPSDILVAFVQDAIRKVCNNRVNAVVR